MPCSTANRGHNARGTSHARPRPPRNQSVGINLAHRVFTQMSRCTTGEVDGSRSLVRSNTAVSCSPKAGFLLASDLHSLRQSRLRFRLTEPSLDPGPSLPSADQRSEARRSMVFVIGRRLCRDGNRRVDLTAMVEEGLTLDRARSRNNLSTSMVC
jgi:hypothetical protein